MRRYVIFCLLCTGLFFSFATASAASEEKPLQAVIYVDEQPVKTEYIVKNGHLYVPALFLKHAGAFVNWNRQYNAVIFQHNEKMISFPVGKKVFYEFLRKENRWDPHPLAEVTMKMNGTPYVPLVTVAKALEMDVTYDRASRKTYVTSNVEVAENQLLYGDRRLKVVALTFDDGPDDYYTPQILDILKEKNVPATFFMMGKNVAKYPQQVKRIVQEGHGIGNHTYDHPDLRKAWTTDVTNQIQSTQYELMRVVGRQPDLFRPPYGALTKADVKLLNELGFRNILWSVDTLDWKGKTGEEILEIVHEQVFPGGIILQHNFGATGGELHGTIEALPMIIDELRKEGYTFVTVQTMLDLQKWNR